jgi:hypothetical protein
VLEHELVSGGAGGAGGGVAGAGVLPHPAIAASRRPAAADPARRRRDPARRRRVDVPEDTFRRAQRYIHARRDVIIATS